MRIDPVLILSATELWERFTYYAMRALLVLYLVAAPATGGFGLADRDATAIYGLFVATVYFAALPGGWIADRYLGPVRAIWLGGALIVAGNTVLAVAHELALFGAGLATIAFGVGLLKPNVTTLVGRAAEAAAQPLDGAFTIFYIGINIGGLLGPVVSAALAARVGWHGGFVASAAGMLIGLVAFSRVARRFPDTGSARQRFRWWDAALALAIVAGAIALMILVPVARLVQVAFGLVVVAAGFGFSALLRGAGTPRERVNVWTLVGLFCGATIFWAAEEQAGASLTLFAERFTDRTIFGLPFPAAWYQSLFPLYVVLLAPLFVLLWQRLASHRREPGPTAKFGAGLGFGAAGLAIAASGAIGAAGGGAAPGWLVLTYLFLAIGEILMAPVGLAAATRLAPAGRIGFATGLWFLSLSLGGLLAGLTGGAFDLGTASGLASTFGSVAAALAVAGATFLLLAWRRR